MKRHISFVILGIILITLSVCFLSCGNNENHNDDEPTNAPLLEDIIDPDNTHFPFATEKIDVTEGPSNVTDEPKNTEPSKTTEEPAVYNTTEAPEITPSPTPKPQPTNNPSAPKDTEFNVVSKTGLIINEVISSNGSIKKADNGNYYDIIEIYNNSDKSVNLSNYYVSDKSKNLLLWKLPNKTLEAQGIYYFYATGESSNKPDFASFSIGSDGEKIYLSDGEGNVVDAVDVPRLPRDMSFGRNGDAFVIYKNPTVGAKNEGLYYLGMAEDVQVNVLPGIYQDAQNVKLSADGTIYYTTDGSRPSLSSKKYDGETINVSKSMAIRAYTVKDGYADSPVLAFNYLVKIPDYELDVVTLSTKKSEFDNMQEHYADSIEIEANISYFSKGIQKFSENCGIEINGQTSQAFEKKSFKVSFKSKYGASKLKYKLFDDSDQKEFDKFVLRSGGGAQASYCAFINDEFFTSIVNDSSNINTVYSQFYKPVNLYINGEYWGLYFIREKINEDFVANRLGVTPSSVSILVELQYLEHGDSDRGWRDLYNFICTKSLTDDANYNYVASKIDLKSVADFYILQAFSGNFDASNVRVCKSSENDGKWRFIFYDLDYSFGYKKDTPKYLLRTFSKETHDGLDSANAIIYKLMKTSKFQTILFERLDLLTTNELSSKNLQSRWDNLMNLIRHDMEYSIKRWSGHECEPGLEHTHNTMEDWERVAKTARDTYLSEAYVKNFVECFKSVGASMLEK